MSDLDEWTDRLEHLKRITGEIHKLSQEQMGSSSTESRYIRALRYGYRQIHVAEDFAATMVEILTWDSLPPRPSGPPAASCIAATVRFALDTLGWRLETAAQRTGISTQQFRRVRDGTCDDPTHLVKVVTTLTAQGIDMEKLAALFRQNSHTVARDSANDNRRSPKRRAANGPPQ